jgi:hypothetical protein
MTEETIPEWRRLVPHRPLSAGDDAYVVRPVSGGDAIANWVEAGGTTVLVNGPTGVGKSTELARAALALQRTRVACLVQTDRSTNMHRLTENAFMWIVAAELVILARSVLGLPVSEELTSAVAALRNEHRDLPPKLFRTGGANAARVAVEEIARLSHQRIALVIDGLEKLPQGPDASEIFGALSSLPELVDLVVVIPWHVAFGGGTEAILRAGEHLHRVAALDTEGPEGLETASFFARMLARRLLGVDALPTQLEPLLGTAFKLSGGIPRVFLQLMADAGTYARVKRGAAWPDDSDLVEAIRDQEDSFRRTLLPGDTDAIRSAIKTDGRELELARRVRLLAQGVLLERVRNGQLTLELHPLALSAVTRSRP